MSGGMKITDHKSIGTPGGKESVFKKGVHVKAESDDGHDGHISKYEDTTEAIKSQQEMNKKKAKGHDMKPGYRN